MAYKRLILVLISIIAVTSTVSAHGFIVREIPENRAALDRPPTRVQYWFSESLEVEFSSLNIRDQSGNIVATGAVDPDNPALLWAQLPPNLPDGAYIVELRPAFASDGHVNAESRVFFVGSVAGDVEGQIANDSAVPLEVFWRAITLSATMLVFGAFTLYSGVLVPAWGNTSYPAGLLPPRVMRRLNWIIGSGLTVAILGNILALMQQAMSFFNVGLGEVLSQNLWGVVRIGSRFGDVWNIRMILLFIVAELFAASVYYRERQPKLVRASLTANVWAMALVIGTFSVVSHAAGSLMQPYLSIVIDWIHGVGVGFWVGGLMALVLVLPVALQPYTGDQKRVALLAVLKRYSRVALAAALIVITTGIFSASTWIYTPDELTNTNFGLALLLKIALVVAMLGVGAVHYIALSPERFSRSLQRIGFLTTLRLEAIFALVVLGAAGLLSATPVPVPDFTQNQSPAPSGSQMVNGYEVTVTISPGGPGVNTYDVQVLKGDTPTDGLDVQVQQIFPALDLRRDFQTADPIDGGVYVAADGAIDRAGEWWSVVNIRDQNGELIRAAFRWNIRKDASVIQSQPLGVQNLIALGLVILVLAWAAYPTAKRFYHQLDLNPTSVTIAVGATVATIAIVVITAAFYQQTQEQYALLTNPPPELVNTVLPDAESLARGKALYEQVCAGWDENADDLNYLRQLLPTMKDEAILDVVTLGWRGLPACEGDLSQAERWDMVNYIRS